jgi:putative transposase
MLAALLRPIFTAGTGEGARELVGDALERLRKPLPRIAELLEEAEEDLLAFYAFPPSTGRSCARPIRSSGSTARSEDAPTSSASSPTTAR